ncbi:HNH endonuclease [Exiguobacterium sp. R-39]|uniref:HNH endonuclease n=1 Tax=Exiguobacterium sp. R-39 TaxID=3416708 RepID=UPI003CEFB0C0
MELFVLPASNKVAQKHLDQTIRQNFDYKEYLVNFSNGLQKKLKQVENSGGNINLWGANVGRFDTWRQMNPDDKVIFYSSDEFIYYGTIIATHHDSEKVMNVWNTDQNKKETFEYLIFLKDIRNIKISRTDFNKKFIFSPDYYHQRLLKVVKSESFKDLDELIDSLDKTFVIDDDNDEYSRYQDEINSNENFEDVSEEVKGGRKRKNKLVKKGTTTWPRDPKVATDALYQAEYKCELEPSHKSFPHIKSNRQYMEAHHLIPMKAQDEHDYDLDTQSNIVSLCPNCHRAIHHANKEFRHDLVKKLYERRIERLKYVGIDCQVNQILNYY